MKLSDVYYGSGHAYYCSKNGLICHAASSHADDGALLIVEELLGDGGIMGHLYYSEACYLTPLADTLPHLTEQYLRGIGVGELAMVTMAACTLQPTPRLLGKRVVIAGSFSVPRREAKKRLEALGAKVVGAVSTKTDLLFYGKNSGSKLTKAKDLGIPRYGRATLCAIMSAF